MPLVRVRQGACAVSMLGSTAVSAACVSLLSRSRAALSWSWRDSRQFLQPRLVVISNFRSSLGVVPTFW